MSPWGSGAEPPTPEDRAAWARGEGVEPGEFRTLPAPPPVAPAQRPEPCPETWGGLPCRFPAGHDGPHGCAIEEPFAPPPVAAREEDPFCPQHGPARASNHAPAGCTCRPGDAREEQPRIEGVSSRPLSGAEVQAYHAAMASSGYFDPVRPSAPPAPSPDVAALVSQLADAAYEVGGATLHVNSANSKQQERYWEERRAGLLEHERKLRREVLAAFAAQARRTEEAEREAETYRAAWIRAETLLLPELQQRLAAAEAKLAEAAEDLANATGGFDAAMGLADAEQERAKAAEQRVRDLEERLAAAEAKLAELAQQLGNGSGCGPRPIRRPE